ncbi:dihydroorotate dehydrogenase electron transfer subunit [Haloimpatiens sp. FM7330]|uniref:dihydroorotate dehydrogenase electron transfer subunit n=1 Tax=Haloimpatiens sp. FM7330 TaxID=3298610 RepID=UPI0036425005
MICSVEKVIENIEISKDIYKVSIKGNSEAVPGQFYMLKTTNEEPLLPRPISVYDVSKNCITFLYKVVGRGTELISRLKKDEEIQILGPLGNSFDRSKLKGKVALVSGGIGIAPLTFLTKRLENCSVDFYAGFCDYVYAVDNVEKNVNNLYISTEKYANGNNCKNYTQKNNCTHVDNSYITDIFDPSKYDIVVCCGPKIMMKKVVQMCKEKKVPIYVSMENRMACGIGACLGCTCKTNEGNKRVCSEGPVFNGEDLILDE